MDRKSYVMLIIALVSLGVSNFLIFAPQFLLPDYIQLDPKDLVMFYNDARRNMVQLFGLCILVTGMYLIYRRIITLEKNVIMVREMKTTERFTRAIDQLGTYKLEVQLGGIFALEKIAVDSPVDHWMIMEILTAYIRENTKWSEVEQSKTNAITPNRSANGHNAGVRIPTDIQAILTVIGRRRWVNLEIEEMKIINLRLTNLAYADLKRASLERTNLRGCSLKKANLTEAKLASAFLAETDLTGANLLKADLRGANLVGANLEGANLRDANLEGANLLGANLRGTFLLDAQLEGANFTKVDLKNGNLCGVSLMGVDLTNTKLNRVKYDYDTVFPEWLSQNMKEELRMSFQH